MGSIAAIGVLISFSLGFGHGEPCPYGLWNPDLL